MTVWRGRLFGPALPPAGSEVQVALDNGALSLRAAGEYPRRVAVSALTARYTGFNDSQFELAWHDRAGA